ncbi:MAG: hypothetical protein PHG63_01900, partial [Candidatus Dojkabacteria bacterium]|nr:hypothetical protein [Candidatus Dojkabacteria bacterium]
AHISHDCGEFDTRGYSFNVSYPVYVTWTFDWEGNDVKQQYLNDMDELTRKHRDFPLTHFFNPRIYATDRVSPERAEYLTQWVIDRRDQYGHQIELHIHMFTDMVSAAGVAPHSDPAWGWTTHDGYDVLVSGYSYDDTNKIVDWATAQFIAHGLGTPTMFRAGGWFADEETLLALQDNGFIADSSGRTAFSIGTNNAVSPWNLSITAQPFQPNVYDQNSSAYPTMKIWELPNNGGDSWAFSKDDMYNRYRANYAGGVSDRMTVVTYLSHPDWFYEDKPKMDALLTDIERDLYADDNGPVIFGTLEDVYLTWTSN